MFKLIKILNSGVNVSEPVKLTAAEGVTLKAGTLGIIDAGSIRPCTATETPTHLIGRNAKGGEAIPVYPIGRDMIFDCPVSQNPSALTVGAKVTLAIEDGAAVGVSATTAGGVAEIFDLAGASAAGDSVSVRF